RCLVPLRGHRHGGELLLGLVGLVRVGHFLSFLSICPDIPGRWLHVDGRTDRRSNLQSSGRVRLVSIVNAVRSVLLPRSAPDAPCPPTHCPQARRPRSRTHAPTHTTPSTSPGYAGTPPTPPAYPVARDCGTHAHRAGAESGTCVAGRP